MWYIERRLDGSNQESEIPRGLSTMPCVPNPHAMGRVVALRRQRRSQASKSIDPWEQDEVPDNIMDPSEVMNGSLFDGLGCLSQGY